MVCDYDNIAESVTLTAEDYVVVMTNGHSGDLIIEEQAPVRRTPISASSARAARSRSSTKRSWTAAFRRRR